jgi:hypothetical protein
MALARNWFTARDKRKGEVLFCTMGRIRVRKVTIPGDGLPLPTTVVVEGLNVPSAGTYDLLGALVQSNGDLRLIVDHATRVVPVAIGRQVVTEGQIDWVGTDIR